MPAITGLDFRRTSTTSRVRFASTIAESGAVMSEAREYSINLSSERKAAWLKLFGMWPTAVR
jgi:hypothetical protein